LRKKRFEEKIDDTTKNTQQRVNEMERMQEELNNLRSKLKDSNNNSTETVLQQLIAASKEICAQAKQHANQNLQSPKKKSMLLTRHINQSEIIGRIKE